MNKKILITKLLMIFSVVVLNACILTTDEKKIDKVKASDAQMQLGVGYLQFGELALAKEPLKKAIELNKKNADAYGVLALVFQREQENKLAEQNFLKALKIEPKNSRILTNYAMFLRQNKRYDEAMKHFEKASEDPLYIERASIFEHMGFTALELNKLDDAKGYFQRAVHLDWRKGGALIELTELSYNDHNYDVAYNYYSSFIRLVNDGIYEQTAHTLAVGIKAAKAKGKKLEAVNYGVQLRDLYPDSSEYKQYLAED